MPPSTRQDMPPAKSEEGNVGEPIHPTYGTLDQLLAEIRSDIRAGYDVRIGLQGALNWFSGKYAEMRVLSNEGAAHDD